MTTALSVKFIKGIPCGKPQIARATRVGKGTRLGSPEGNMLDAEGQLYAMATAMCMVVSTKKL